MIQRIRFQHWLVLAIGLTGHLTGLPSNLPAQDTNKFVTKYSPISFTFPRGWRENTENHPFDLQTISARNAMNTGVFVFRDSDVEKNSTPADILELQIDDIRKKRQNFRELTPKRVEKHADKVVTSVSYSGERNGYLNHYHFSLIEFKKDKTRFAVTLQVATPESWKQAEPVFRRILKSARLIREVKRPKSPVKFISKYVPVSFTFPADWSKNPKKHPFDLQTRSSDQQMNTGVFVFKDSDLQADQTPADILELQIEDIRSKRQNFVESESQQVEKLDDKTITWVTFSGVRNDMTNYYRFSLIEFADDKSKFVVTLQIATPEVLDKSKSVFREIVHSAIPVGDSKSR